MKKYRILSPTSSVQKRSRRGEGLFVVRTSVR
jgi:hypothetical protein